jgi:hypothetical protein
VNGEKLTELIVGWSLLFTKAGWFKGAASMFPEARGTSCGLKTLVSKEKMPVVRQALAAVVPVVDCLSFPNSFLIW